MAHSWYPSSDRKTWTCSRCRRIKGMSEILPVDPVAGPSKDHLFYHQTELHHRDMQDIPLRTCEELVIMDVMET